MIDLRDPDQRAAAAGEYVLGTLSAEDHTAVAAALAHDATLRAEVYAWQDRLLALSVHAAPAAPPAPLWSRIERSLAAVGAAAARARPAPARAPWWQSLAQSLRVWQGITAVAVAAAVFMALRVVAPPAESSARYLAVLQSPQDQSTGWVVELQTGRGLRLVPVGDRGAVPPGRAWQFWTKPEGAAGPTSLGLVKAGQTVEMPLSRLPAMEAQQLFEITLEPEAGSPIGRPTGPILYVGRTVAL